MLSASTLNGHVDLTARLATGIELPPISGNAGAKSGRKSPGSRGSSRSGSPELGANASTSRVKTPRSSGGNHRHEQVDATEVAEALAAVAHTSLCGDPDRPRSAPSDTRLYTRGKQQPSRLRSNNSAENSPHFSRRNAGNPKAAGSSSPKSTPKSSPFGSPKLAQRGNSLGKGSPKGSPKPSPPASPRSSARQRSSVRLGPRLSKSVSDDGISPLAKNVATPRAPGRTSVSKVKRKGSRPKSPEATAAALAKLAIEETKPTEVEIEAARLRRERAREVKRLSCIILNRQKSNSYLGKMMMRRESASKLATELASSACDTMGAGAGADSSSLVVRYGSTHADGCEEDTEARDSPTSLLEAGQQCSSTGLSRESSRSSLSRNLSRSKSLSKYTSAELSEMQQLTTLECNRLRTMAIKAEKLLVMRWGYTKWIETVRGKYRVGPVAVPSSLDGMLALSETYTKKPTSAATLFVIAMLARLRNRKLGNKLVAAILHPDCLMRPADIGCKDILAVRAKGSLRKHTIRQLHEFVEHDGVGTIPSFVKGTTPEDGYDYDPESITVCVDSQRTGQSVESTKDGEQLDIYITTTGALPTHSLSRCIKVKQFEGRWYARSFAELALPVRPPMIRARAKPLQVDYTYDEVVKSEDVSRFQAPMDFAAIKRRKARMSGETEAGKIARQSNAQAHTGALSQKLAQKQLNKNFSDEKRDRMVVSVKRNGATCKTLVRAGEQYNMAIADEDEFETVEEAERREAVERDKAKLMRQAEMQRRIQSAVLQDWKSEAVAGDAVASQH